MKLKLLFFLCLFIKISNKAQEAKFCATMPGEDYEIYLDEFAQQYYSQKYKRTSLVTRYIPISVHTVGNSDGSSKLGVSAALSAICTLNERFEASNSDIQFYLVEAIDTEINNTNYNTGNPTFSQTNTLLSQNNYSAAINIYFVSSILNNPGVAGYAHGSNFNGAPDLLNAVFVRNGSSTDGSTLAHEVGHNLSLPHTFFGWEGFPNQACNTQAPSTIGGRAVERVNGSNCATTGDRICDTGPDYLPEGFFCASSTNDNGCDLIDPNGESFRVDATNLMSYDFGGCASVFSVDQAAMMNFNLDNYRNSIINNPNNPSSASIITTTSLTPIFPANAESVEGSDISLSWEAVPNATKYYVQVSIIPSFSVLFAEGITDTNSFDLSGMDINRTYHWRVLPYNETYFCSSYLQRNSFSTQPVSVNQIDGLSDFLVFPNPVISTNNIYVSFSLSSSKVLELKLIDLYGRVVYVNNKQYATNNTFAIESNQINAGTYFLSISDGENTTSKKITILK